MSDMTYFEKKKNFGPHIGPSRQIGKKVKWPSLTSNWPRDLIFSVVCFYLKWCRTPPSTLQNSKIFLKWLTLVYTQVQYRIFFLCQSSRIATLVTHKLKKYRYPAKWMEVSKWLTLSLSLVVSGLEERRVIPEQYLSQDLITSRDSEKVQI
jgi:hypothetical protein